MNGEGRTKRGDESERSQGGEEERERRKKKMTIKTGGSQTTR